MERNLGTGIRFEFKRICGKIFDCVLIFVKSGKYYLNFFISMMVKTDLVQLGT